MHNTKTVIQRKEEPSPKNGYFSKRDCKKSVLLPFYYRELSEPEESFIEYLETAKKLKWWFKNVVRDATFFAIPYEENGV